MRRPSAVFSGILILVLSHHALAVDEEVLRGRIGKHLDELTATAKIQDPPPAISTRSPAGPKLYRLVANAVVYIVTTDGVRGSGAVLSRKGLIITNWHVVQNQPIVGVIFKPSAPNKPPTKEDLFFAEVLRTDPLRDLALLQVISPPPNITQAHLGFLSLVEVGQDVFAVSHPRGLLWTYTEGVVSQIRPKNRWESDIGTVHEATVIQTQTVISQGSSGAPLFDGNARLIGILVGTKGPGLNFAIAIDEVRQFTLSSLESGQ